eukprot:2802876-Pyramimonas_sp.AAC.1
MSRTSKKRQEKQEEAPRQDRMSRRRRPPSASFARSSPVIIWFLKVGISPRPKISGWEVHIRHGTRQKWTKFSNNKNQVSDSLLGTVLRANEVMEQLIKANEAPCGSESDGEASGAADGNQEESKGDNSGGKSGGTSKAKGRGKSLGRGKGRGRGKAKDLSESAAGADGKTSLENVAEAEPDPTDLHELGAWDEAADRAEAPEQADLEPLDAVAAGGDPKHSDGTQLYEHSGPVIPSATRVEGHEFKQ